MEAFFSHIDSSFLCWLFFTSLSNYLWLNVCCCTHNELQRLNILLDKINVFSDVSICQNSASIPLWFMHFIAYIKNINKYWNLANDMHAEVSRRMCAAICSLLEMYKNGLMEGYRVDTCTGMWLISTVKY